ncbi:hypothetical protein JXQ70_06305, partial [bacterium]|nr:hypothetical protein [bacterium]
RLEMPPPPRNIVALVLCSCLLFSVPAMAASLTSVTVDTESYQGNPWKIFHYDLEVEPDDGPTPVRARIRFVDLHGCSEVDFDEYWDPATKPFPERKYVAYTDTVGPGEEERSYQGVLGCAGVVLEDNASLDSYDRSLGDYFQSNAADLKVYSNATIIAQGSAEVYGSLYAHDIVMQGDSFLTGEQVISPDSWDCLHSGLEEVTNVVMTVNDNSRLVIESQSDLNLQSEALDINLSGSDRLFLPEGVYYFNSLTLSENAVLEIQGKVILFCLSDAIFDDNAEINAVGTTKHLSINSLEGSIELHGQARVWAELYAPLGTISLDGGSEAFGRAVADQFRMSGQSMFHFNREAMEQYLRLSQITVYGVGGNEIGTKLVPTLTLGHQIIIWKIELGPNGHYHRWNWIDGSWVDVGRMHLAGYSDYQMIFDARIMYYLVGQHHEENLCRYILGYQELSGEWKRLNFHRAWTTPWSVQQDPIGTSFNEEYNFPWKVWPGPGRWVVADEPLGDFVEFCRGFRMSVFVECTAYDRTDPETHLCYWNRWKRLLDDTMAWGAVVEIDLFENSLMKMDQNQGSETCADNNAWGIYARIDKGGWKESPWNPSNQCGGGNELDPIESPTTVWPECDVVGSNYNLYGTNYFFLTAPGTSENLPILKNQQELLVKAVVSYCKPWKNIIYHAMNEPAYNYWQGYECREWHKMVVLWINEVIGSATYKPQFGVNVFGDDQYSDKEALVALVDGINNAPYAIKVSSVSYHYSVDYWQDPSTNCGNDIDNLITWHRNTNSVKNLACIIDTDGAAGCRDYNPRLFNWASTVHDLGEDFNHKDFLWKYYDENDNWVNIFYVDLEAMRKIYTAFH